MIWMTAIAAFIAFGMLVMMFDEISTGFYRWRDYIPTTILLYAAGAFIFYLGGLVASIHGIPSIIQTLVQLFLGFGLMFMVWGGTLTLGSLIIRLFMYKNRT